MSETTSTIDFDQLARVRELDARGLTAEVFERDVVSRAEPTLLRGLVSHWPIVQASLGPPQAIRDYLARFDSGAPAHAFFAPEEVSGRFSYGPSLEGVNFSTVETRLPFLLHTLVAVADKQMRQAVYMGSTPVDRLLPGLEQENPMPLVDIAKAPPRIWIGNDTAISAHFDEADNIACVVRGKRRFTLFPPEQVQNLYVGPLERTIAGQPISLVDFDKPDFDRYPRFSEALQHARVAEMGPGDAIFIPAVWWHHVRAKGPLNILVNYWWSDAAADAGSPLHALAHGLLAISQLPEAKREAWRAILDHYVFRRNGDPAEHLPANAKGVLDASSPEARRAIREFLIGILRQL